MDRHEAIFPPDELIADELIAGGTVTVPDWDPQGDDTQHLMDLRGADVPGAGEVVRVAVVGGGDAARMVARMLARVYASGGDGRHLISDAGGDPGSAVWRTAAAEADRIVIAVGAAGSGPATGLAVLDAVAGAVGPEVVRRALTVVLLPPPWRGLNRGHEDATAIRDAFGTRTSGLLFAPDVALASAPAAHAWQRVAAAIDTA